MSYDIWLEIDTGGSEPARVGGSWNYTSNCGPIWRAAGADLAEFHDKKAGECAPLLRMAIALMKRDPAKFIAMNPENGWGSYESLVPCLETLAYEFEQHPVCTVKVWR